MFTREQAEKVDEIGRKLLASIDEETKAWSSVQLVSFMSIIAVGLLSNIAASLPYVKRRQYLEAVMEDVNRTAQKNAGALGWLEQQS